jgi:hypothetical protein
MPPVMRAIAKIATPAPIPHIKKYIINFLLPHNCSTGIPKINTAYILNRI